MKEFITFLESFKLDETLLNAVKDAYVTIFESASLETRYWKNNLEKYRNRDDIYVTFTELPKIGINPNNQYKTPTGIYTYNMKDTEKFYKGFNFPYTGSNVPNYVTVLQYDEENILDFDNYSESDFEFDIEKLKYSIENIDPNAYKTIDSLVSKAKSNAVVPSFGGMIWYITKQLSGENVNKWNYILRSMEYNAVRDHGDGIIHTNEPCQTIFLSNKSLEIIEQINMNSRQNQGKTKIIKNIDSENIDRLIKTKSLNIRWAINTKNIGLITKLLASKPFSEDELSKALIDACELDNIQIVKLLLNAGASANFEESRPLKNAIKYADSQNSYNSDIIELLIKHGADPSIDEYSTYVDEVMETI